jgi:hypothetical protein
MVGVAVMLIAWRLHAEMSKIPDTVPWRIVEVVYALAAGAAVGALPLWFSLRRRGAAFPRQPGEWLLVCYGGAILAGEAAWLLVFFAQNSAVLEIRWSAQYAILASDALRVFFFLLPLLWWRGGRWWRAFFLLLFSVSLAQKFCFWMSRFGYPWFRQVLASRYLEYLDYLPVLVLLIAVAQDVRPREKRIWSHYAGVGAYCVLAVGMPLIYWLIRYW